MNDNDEDNIIKIKKPKPTHAKISTKKDAPYNLGVNNSFVYFELKNEGLKLTSKQAVELGLLLFIAAKAASGPKETT